MKNFKVEQRRHDLRSKIEKHLDKKKNSDEYIFTRYNRVVFWLKDLFTLNSKEYQTALKDMKVLVSLGYYNKTTSHGEYANYSEVNEFVRELK